MYKGPSISHCRANLVYGERGIRLRTSSYELVRTLSLLSINFPPSFSMEPASPPQTEYCPSAQQRTRHVDIRTKFPGAVYCPHCAQRLPTALHNAAPISIDLTVDSPLTQRTSTTKNIASRGIITTSSTTVPMPDTYQASTMMAVQNRQSSIAATRIRKDPVVVELSAIFWIGDGYIDDSIPGITIPVYKGIRHAGKRTGSVEVVLGRKFSSHSSMIRFIVEQCDERLKEKEWQVVHSVSTVGATSGPVYFPSGAYNTVTLGDLFSQGNITVTKQRDTANLTFWLFNEGPRPDDDCQRPLRAARGRKRAIDYGLLIWTRICQRQALSSPRFHVRQSQGAYQPVRTNSKPQCYLWYQ